jgi:DNA-binding LacI/PurR family transcriptional regulator
MGRTAVEILLAALSGEPAPDLVVVQPTLVVRSSTDRPRKRAAGS